MERQILLNQLALDGSDRQPPIYYVDRAGNQYVLLSEVGAMVERLHSLPFYREKAQHPGA